MNEGERYEAAFDDVRQEEDFESFLRENPDPDQLESFFENANINQLQEQTPSNMGTADEAKQHLKKMNRAEQKKARQQNKLRKRFFAWAGSTVILSLLANFVLFTVYMLKDHGRVSDPVMIAWISATVVEVLGIAYIIANYLFDGQPIRATTPEDPGTT